MQGAGSWAPGCTPTCSPASHFSLGSHAPWVGAASRVVIASGVWTLTSDCVLAGVLEVKGPPSAPRPAHLPPAGWGASLPPSTPQRDLGSYVAAAVAQPWAWPRWVWLTEQQVGAWCLTWRRGLGSRFRSSCSGRPRQGRAGSCGIPPARVWAACGSSRFVSWSPKRRLQGDPVSVKTRTANPPGPEVDQVGRAAAWTAGSRRTLLFIF